MADAGPSPQINIADNGAVIERQRRQITEREPPGFFGVVTCLNRDGGCIKVRDVHCTHEVAAWIALRVAVRVKLHERNTLHAGLFAQFSFCGLLQ